MKKTAKMRMTQTTLLNWTYMSPTSELRHTMQAISTYVRERGSGILIGTSVGRSPS
jgi:hypothetical protein